MNRNETNRDSINNKKTKLAQEIHSAVGTVDEVHQRKYVIIQI